MRRGVIPSAAASALAFGLMLAPVGSAVARGTALPDLQVNFPVDVTNALVPIGYVGDHPMVIAASNELGVSTLSELIALAKKRKGELNVAAGNRGSILHLTAEWLRIATGIEVTLLHYAAASQALTDILGGRVQVMVDAVPAMRGAIEGGKIKPLAVATTKRLPNFPNLPTVAETIPGFEAVGWLALMAPPGTPLPLAQRISADLRKVLSEPARAAISEKRISGCSCAASK